AVGLHDTLAHGAGHLGAGIADVDLAAGDVVGPAVQGGRAGEPGDRVLGGGVGDRQRARDMGRDRAVVDYPAAGRVLVLHQPERGLGAEEGAGQVDVHDAAPVL